MAQVASAAPTTSKTSPSPSPSPEVTAEPFDESSSPSPSPSPDTTEEEAASEGLLGLNLGGRVRDRAVSGGFVQ